MTGSPEGMYEIGEDEFADAYDIIGQESPSTSAPDDGLHPSCEGGKPPSFRMRPVDRTGRPPSSLTPERETGMIGTPRAGKELVPSLQARCSHLDHR